MELQTNGFEKSQIKILSLLTRLRQICCHPSLFIENYSGESGKIQALEEIMTDAFDSGHRILLFSQFTSMLEIIKQFLDQKSVEFKSIITSFYPRCNKMRLNNYDAFSNFTSVSVALVMN